MKTQDIAKKIKKNSRDSAINFRTITRIKESKKIYNRKKEKKIE
jgi:hypothetical protein